MWSLQRLLLLLSLFYLAIDRISSTIYDLAYVQTPVCGNAGSFDTSALLRQDYWEVELSDKVCSQLFSSSCKLYMAFCRPLLNKTSPITGCPGMGNRPISLCITNTTVGYSMGMYDSSVNPFQQQGDKLLAIYKDGSTYSNCSSSIMTTLEFYCDRLAEWAFVEGDSHGVATDFFDSMFIDVENPCSVTINFKFNGVCTPVLCEAKPHEITTLVEPDYWEVDLDPDECNSFFGKKEKCTLYLSFCKNLNGVTGCSDSAVCVTDGTQSYSFGEYNKYINPFYPIEQTLVVTYGNGRPYPACPATVDSPPTTLLILRCMPGAIWEHSNTSGNVTSYLDVAEPSPEDGCTVDIVMDYSGACVKYSSKKVRVTALDGLD